MTIDGRAGDAAGAQGTRQSRRKAVPRSSTYTSPDRRQVFDRAIEEFAGAYADQNDRDYATYLAAIRAGRVRAQPG